MRQMATPPSGLRYRFNADKHLGGPGLPKTFECLSGLRYRFNADKHSTLLLG